MDNLFENRPKVVKFVRNSLERYIVSRIKWKKNGCLDILTYLNHMSFCSNCLHFSSEVDCMYMHMWVFSLQMSDYTGQRGNSALVYLIFLTTARYCSLAHPWGLPPSIVPMEVVKKKSEQAGPYPSMEEWWCLYVDPFSTTKRWCLV